MNRENKYFLNPLSPCFQKYGIDNIRGFKDCCYSTCARLEGGDDIDMSDMLNSRCGALCALGVDEVLKTAGKNPCEFKMPPPPLWLQKSYFINEFNRLGNIETALASCKDLCGDDDECKENCVMDSKSIVETFKGNKSVKTTNLSNPSAFSSALKVEFALGLAIIIGICIYILHKKFNKNN